MDLLEEVENVLLGIVEKHFYEFFFFDESRVGNVEEAEKNLGSFLFAFAFGDGFKFTNLSHNSLKIEI